MPTLRSDELLPGPNVSCALPSALVTVPPVVAEINVGGARASVDEDEPVGGLVVGSADVLVSVLVAAAASVEGAVASVPDPAAEAGGEPESMLVVPVWLASALAVPDPLGATVGCTDESEVDTVSTVGEDTLVSVDPEESTVVSVAGSTVVESAGAVVLELESGGVATLTEAASSERTRRCTTGGAVWPSLVPVVASPLGAGACAESAGIVRVVLPPMVST